jgi:phage terminase large subunit
MSAAAPGRVINLGYNARPQFVAFHHRKQRWACLVCHRRAGKTVAAVMDLVDAALRTKKPDARFSFMAPTYAQGKDVAFGYLKKYTEAIPGVEQRESDLSVIFKNGARVRIYGSENYDRLRGGFNDGVVMDEFGDWDPRAWPEVIRPTLADRGGWAVFIGTPRGRNQFWEIYRQARNDPDWYTLVLKASETDLLPQEELDDLRRALSPSVFAQEMECSFETAVAGAVYARELDAARDEGRITRVMHDPAMPVDVYFDLGFADHTAIWFAQHVQGEIRLIDHHEENGHAFPHYMQLLQARGYTYRTMWLPHDARAKQLGTGRSVEEMARNAGWRVRIVAKLDVDDGINATRVMFANMWFDETRCERGLLALRNYRFKADMAGTPVSKEPVHDWSSHSSDALRMVGVAMQEAKRATFQGYDGPPKLRQSVRERGSVGWLRG